MQIFIGHIAKAALMLALAGAAGGTSAAITISEPEFLDEDTFLVMVALADPFGTALDALDLSLGIDNPPFSLVQVVKQPGVPGNLESDTPSFRTISYLTAATIPTGPLFELTFDVTSPPGPEASIDVTVTGRAIVNDEEFEIPLSGSITFIPEPATYALVGAGLVLVAWTRRWRRIALS
jgi:hypothetical protein